MDLVDLVYDSTSNWPPDERYGLANQANERSSPFQPISPKVEVGMGTASSRTT